EGHRGWFAGCAGDCDRGPGRGNRHARRRLLPLHRPPARAVCRRRLRVGGGAGRSGDMRAMKAVIVLVTTSSLIGLLLAALLAPVAFLGSRATTQAHRFYEGMPQRLVEPPLPQQSVIVDRKGKRLGTIQSYNRTAVPLSKMAPILHTSVVAVEDSRFYTH